MHERSQRAPAIIGVGLDTARYGHHASFLREDRQPAAKPLEFLENRRGYEQLDREFRKLAQKYPDVHFQIRVDAAGQYAVNLLDHLHQLPWSKTISVGEPTRNKRYRQVHFPKRKADAVDSLACARFAVVERPGHSPGTPSKLLVLREVASRLEFQVKQSTRQVNRLHNLLARVFPELATLHRDLQTRWVLNLLEKYPTAERIAKARLRSLTALAYVSETKARAIHQAAKQSVACERGDIVEALVRHSIHGLQESLNAETRLEKLLVEAFRALPDQRARQIATIKGIGERTAAVLVAKIVSIDRFPSADHLTGYFGVFPEENTSGVDRYGNPVPPGAKYISRKGNDLVRKHLWMAALSAITCNPAVRECYARLRARGRRGDVALGHCMKKLLHQVFGIWNSGRPYDPHYPGAPSTTPASNQKEAEGRKTGTSPQSKTVTPTSPDIVASEDRIVKHTDASEQLCSGAVDFAFLRSQISIERVLAHLGYLGRLRGATQQRRGPCPLHGSRRDRGRTFSVHLGKNLFQCFHPPCGAAGNVIDLWSALHQLTPYEAARHLAVTFNLPLKPDTEKRNP